jgi:hypothetical protein
MRGRGGHLAACAHADGGPAGRGAGGRSCGTVGAAHRASARAGGCCVGCRAPSGRGGRPLTDIDGRGRALRSGDGRGCGGLAVSGGGDGHAGDGGRRRTDRRCSAAGGAVRSRTAGAAARRAAAPERERRGTAGDQPAPAGTQHLRRVLAHGRCRVCVGCTRSPRPQEATASLCISMTRPNAGNRPKYPTFSTRGLGSA